MKHGLAVLLLLPLAAACHAAGSPRSAGTPTRAPFAGCAGLSLPPRPAPSKAPGAPSPGGSRRAQSGVVAAGGPAAGDPTAGGDRDGVAAGGSSLPALTLPCYSGGDPVALASLRGPAVVNLWASWCPPCRRELPVLRDFAGRNRGRVHVIGVVSTDSRSASAALAADLGLTFPHLYDEGGALLRALRRPGLPATAFVDAQGQVRMVYGGEAFDRGTLEGLVRQHLGVSPR